MAFSRMHLVRARQPLTVRRVSLDAGIRKRFVLAADLHVDDRFMPRPAVTELVDAINVIDGVDAVLMPGDFIGTDTAALAWLGRELSRLGAPAFASLGNHDLLFDDGELVQRVMDEAGVRLLVNDSVQFTPDLWIGGLDSAVFGKPDVAAMRTRVPARGHCVVLGHEPWLATLHKEVLHVAGHTHHGQIRIPRVRPLYLPARSQPYPEGLYEVAEREGPRWIYTTAGVGSTTLPVRIGCPPEIVVIDT